jgi:UDP-GlcNAc:undecaprenyl-phosphate GlcNAc-1-phosphate transferase
MTPLTTNLLVAAVAAAISFAVAGLVRRVALDRGIVVPPRPDRWHQVPTPTYGGIGVCIGVLAGASFGGGLDAAAWPVLLAGGALFVVGWFDDVMPMSALAKMVASLAVAAFFVVSIASLRTGTPMSAALTILAILCFGGLDNAVNLLDNMDGLAGGVTAVAAAGLALTFGAELGPAIVAVLMALSGALVGFLGWNRYPARMFMGNCGSLAIGGILAASATLAVVRSATLRDAAAALLILVVPVFDSSFVILLRRLAGRSTTRGNIDHTSHRLVSAGFNDRTAVWVLYAMGAAGAVAGAFVHANAGGSAVTVAAAVGVGTLMVALWLARVPAYEGQDFRAIQNAPFAPLINDLTFRWHAGEVLLDIILISACYYAAYRVRFEGDADLPVFMSTFAKSLPAILGTQLAALYASGLYKRLWRTFGLHDLSTVMRAVGSGVILSVLVVTYLYKFQAFSRSVFLIYAVLLTAAIVATRSSFRVFGRMAARTSARKRVAIYGAGARGLLLARELQTDEDSRMPVAFIDDDESKQSRRLVGVAVRGTARDLEALLAKYRIDEVLISTPAIGADAEARVREICAAKGVSVARLFYEIR